MTEWTDEKDQFLREHYGRLTAKRIARVIDVDHQSIYKRAQKLGLESTREWGRGEDLAIRLLYFRGAKVVSQYISDRSVGSIWARAWRLGLAKQREEWIDD